MFRSKHLSNTPFWYFIKSIVLINSDHHELSRMLISNMSPMYDDHIFVTCLSSFFFLINLFAFLQKTNLLTRHLMYLLQFYQYAINFPISRWFMVTEKRISYDAKAINLLYFITMSLEFLHFPTIMNFFLTLITTNFRQSKNYCIQHIIII